MSAIQTQRAQVLAEAVVSAYIHELAAPASPRERRPASGDARTARARAARRRLASPARRRPGAVRAPLYAATVRSSSANSSL